MEITGGRGQTAELLALRNCAGGLRFDYAAGVGSMSPRDLRFHRKYLVAADTHIIVAAPRRAGRACPAALNRAINYRKWAGSRRACLG